jgi:hypothetical protein
MNETDFITVDNQNRSRRTLLESGKMETDLTAELMVLPIGGNGNDSIGNNTYLNLALTHTNCDLVTIRMPNDSANFHAENDPRAKIVAILVLITLGIILVGAIAIIISALCFFRLRAVSRRSRGIKDKANKL